ncbi:MAG: hypothetical protein O2960_14005 [Verrucomicrobia bacterium]|nr:hypothetical protein [Verrucomicrobiota bacterium]
MNPNTLFLLAGIVGWSCAGTKCAEPADDTEQSPRARLMQGFEGKAPVVGSPVPEVKAFDSDGMSINLRDQLNGRHTVLVFGCLT